MAKAATDDVNQNNSGEVGGAKAKSKCITEQMSNKGIEKAGVATDFKTFGGDKGGQGAS